MDAEPSRSSGALLALFWRLTLALPTRSRPAPPPNREEHERSRKPADRVREQVEPIRDTAGHIGLMDLVQQPPQHRGKPSDREHAERAPRRPSPAHRMHKQRREHA